MEAVVGEAAGLERKGGVAAEDAVMLLKPSRWKTPWLVERVPGASGTGGEGAVRCVGGAVWGGGAAGVSCERSCDVCAV